MHRCNVEEKKKSESSVLCVAALLLLLRLLAELKLRFTVTDNDGRLTWTIKLCLMFANVTTAQYSSPPVVVKRALLQRLLESNNTLLFGSLVLCSEYHGISSASFDFPPTFVFVPVRAMVKDRVCRFFVSPLFLHVRWKSRWGLLS